MPPGFFTPADADALAQYCIAWVFWGQAVFALAGGAQRAEGEDGGGSETKGLIAEGSQGQPVVSPYIAVKRAQEDVLKNMGDRLGLSPAARTRLSNPGEEEVEDPDDRFFGRAN